MKRTMIASDGYRTRGKRRAAVSSVISCLSEVRDAEQRYLDNVPENFQCIECYDVGELAVDALDEIIGMMADIY